MDVARAVAARWYQSDALGTACPASPRYKCHWGGLPAARLVAVTGKSDSIHDSKGKEGISLNCSFSNNGLFRIFLPRILMILWCVVLDRDGCCPKIHLISDKVLKDLSER